MSKMMGRIHATIGDTTRPRQYCLKCGEVVYCDNIWSNFPPRTAELRLKRIHKQTLCDGEIQYMCGLSAGLFKSEGRDG